MRVADARYRRNLQPLRIGVLDERLAARPMKTVTLRDFHYRGLKAPSTDGTTFMGRPHRQRVPASSRVTHTPASTRPCPGHVGSPGGQAAARPGCAGCRGPGGHARRPPVAILMSPSTDHETPGTDHQAQPTVGIPLPPAGSVDFHGLVRAPSWPRAAPDGVRYASVHTATRGSTALQDDTS
jgi:hypothetical protein